MTILCEPDERQVADLLPSLPGEVRTVSTLPDLALAVANDPTHRVVVIGSDVDLEPALSFSAQFRKEHPDAAVILLRGEIDPAVMSRAADAGIRSVLPNGHPALLADAFSRESGGEPDPDPQVAEQRSPLGEVVTVFSAKGGCGKTTVATNLAVALHGGGRRRVCIVDLDLAFGDVAICMQLTPRRTLVDAVESGTSVENQLDELTTAVRPGFDAILAPVEPGDAERIPASLVIDLLKALQSRYDYIVIDTPSQFSEHVLSALDMADHHVLLTTPEIPALKNLRLTLDTLDVLGYPAERRAVVLNRSDERGGLSPEDVTQATQAPLAGRIPASHDVPASINRGVPIVQALPDHPVSKAITDLATRALAGESTTGAGPSGRRGLRLRKRSE